jgi:hypothetical protein
MRGLLQLLVQHVSVIGVAREGSGSHHQAALVRDGDAGLDAKFVGLAGFAFANALDLRRVQGVELVLVLRLLGADALGTFQQRRSGG